jgi:hypothetical protein
VRVIVCKGDYKGDCGRDCRGTKESLKVGKTAVSGANSLWD